MGETKLKPKHNQYKTNTKPNFDSRKESTKMNISSLKPIQIDTADALAKVEQATKNQSLRTSTPRTFDPNFPLFSFTTNDKHLVYIPNFFTEDEEGKKELITEKAYVHAIQKGRQFMQLRATHGLQGLEEYGISGNSPLNEATQTCWELYNLKYKAHAASQGIDPSDDKGEVLKPKRVELLGQRVVKDADLKIYFPIAVIETEKDPKTGINTFKPVPDTETGMPKFQLMWIEVSETQWNDKWVKVLDSLDDGDSLAGQLLSLNYKFTDNLSAEKNARRDSGKALTINIRPVNDDWKAFFAMVDEKAKDWTPAKARETIIAASLLSDEQQQAIVDDVMQDTLLELNSMKSMELGGGAPQQAIETNQGQTPADALSNFGGIQMEEETTTTTESTETLSFGK